MGPGYNPGRLIQKLQPPCHHPCFRERFMTNSPFSPAPQLRQDALEIREPYYSVPPRQWVKATDCRPALSDLAENQPRSVSLTVMDPPYFIDGMGADWDPDKLKGRVRKGVVGGIPAGQKFDPTQGRKLQEYLTPVAERLLSVMKPGAFALCFSQARLAHRTAVAFEDAGFEIRDLLAWQYEGQAKAAKMHYHVRRKRLSPDEEAQWLAAVGDRKTPQVKPQMETIVLAQAPKVGDCTENWVRYRTGLIDVSNPVVNPERSPGQLIPVPKPRQRYNHMTPKPVDLLRHLIRLFSDDTPGTLVIDPFAGTGSAGVAARLEGRDFIGFELDPATALAANQRVEEMRV